VANRTILYHKIDAPTGHEFDLETVSLAQLVEAGWVDDPAKIGVNVWGHEGSQQAVAQTQARFDRGDMPPVDIPGASTPTQLENERLKDEIARLRAQLGDLRQPLTEDQQIAQHNEYEADMRSDAAKLQEKGQRAADDPSPLDRQMTEQAQETRFEQQQQVADAERRQADGGPKIHDQTAL